MQTNIPSGLFGSIKINQETLIHLATTEPHNPSYKNLHNFQSYLPYNHPSYFSLPQSNPTHHLSKNLTSNPTP